MTKKLPSNKDVEETSQRKAIHTPNLGHSGFKLKIVTKVKECAADFPEDKAMQRHQRNARKLCFDTMQALCSHRVNFKAAKDACASQKRVELDTDEIADEFATIAKDKIEEKPRPLTCVSEEQP